MKKSNLSRRQFLRGMGGFSLALPFLPSLLPRQAKAATLGRRHFVAMATQHGGIWPQHMYPGDSLLSQSFDYAGRNCRWGNLEGISNTGWTTISPVLSGPNTLLSPGLIEKMNLIRGVDIPWYIAHHTGGHLGNYARNDGNGSEGREIQNYPMPTIDQIMAWAEGFYPDMSGVTERSIAMGAAYMSYNYASPTSRTGPIQSMHNHQDNQQIFQRLFTPGESPNSPNPYIVDRVLENYNRIRNGNRRLSADDRRRLDEHMQRLYEVERRVNISPQCDSLLNPEASTESLQALQDYHYNPEANIAFWQLHNDIIAMAIDCGVCSVFSMNASETFSTFQGNWHQDIAHQAHGIDGSAQGTIMDAHQIFFEGVFLDLASKLNAIDNGQGGTLLDDTLVMWTQESGMVTHQSYSIPIVTAGSACGAFETGRYVDYRNLNISYDYGSDYPSLDLVEHPGLFYNQWLGTILQGMGLNPSTYESDGGGYGYFYVNSAIADDYSGAATTLSESLPIITG